MPFLSGTKPEQVPVWGQIMALLNPMRWRLFLLPTYTLADLKASRGLLAKAVYITDPAKMGTFYRDDADTATADDNQDVLVTADGVRYKRRVVLRKYTPVSNTDTSMDTGSVTYDNDLFYIKTGASTIGQIPFRLLTQGISVATTAPGGPSDANYWAKIATVTSTGSNSDINLIIAYSVSGVPHPAGAGTIRFSARSSGGGAFYYGGFFVPSNSVSGVKIVRVTDTAFDIWVQKPVTYQTCRFVLVGMGQNNAHITWYQSAAWVASTGGETSINLAPESSTGQCTTATRPAPLYLNVGYNIWDTTISKQIFWNGSAWRDAQGAAV